MTPEDLQKLAEQLDRLPGGSQAAIPDFFATLIGDGLAPITSDWDVENWPCKEGGVLALRLDPAYHAARLFHVRNDADEIQIAALPIQLMDVARAYGASPIVLALLAIAAGHVDDGRELKVGLPRIDGAAKDLMLMTVCRLCG
ncbi:MAG: hypothetical protein AB1697_06335 [Pseudomonadota bacterium]